MSQLPEGRVAVSIPVSLRASIGHLTDLWNEHFHDGTERIGMGGAMRLLMNYYQHVDSRECTCGCKPTLMDFEKWISELPRRGRPRKDRVKHGSRKRNPLSWEDMSKRQK